MNPIFLSLLIYSQEVVKCFKNERERLFRKSSQSSPFTIALDTVIAPVCANVGGSVALSLAKGCPPFELVYNNTNISTDSTMYTINDLPSGANTILVTDANMETDTVVVFLDEPTGITSSITANVVLCATQQPASIQANATGGTGALSYAWSTGDSTANLANLSAGIYYLTVSDANNCEHLDSISVDTEGLLPLSISVEPISCHDSADGMATVAPLSGLSPFSWEWLDGQTSSTIDNLSGGSYSVTVTDALGCTDALDFSILPPDTLGTGIAITPSSCDGSFTGGVMAIAEGGTGTYSYEWNTNASDASLSNLNAGEYSVTVSDVKGCTDTASIALTEPPPLMVSIEGAENLCYDELGALAVTATGGSYPYHFEWSTGVLDSVLQDISGGDYTVTVSDANACDTVLDYTILQSDAISLEATVIDNTDANAPNGSIVVDNITGGMPDYSYWWEDGTTSSTLSNLPAGMYALTVTDADSCQQVFTFEVDFINSTAEPYLLDMQVYPNPADSKILFDFASPLSRTTELNVMDWTGRIVWQNKLSKGTQVIHWDTSMIPNGGYIYSIRQSGNMLRYGKIMVQH